MMSREIIFNLMKIYLKIYENYKRRSNLSDDNVVKLVLKKFLGSSLKESKLLLIMEKCERQVQIFN